MKIRKTHFSFWRKLEPERLAKGTLIAIKDTSPAAPQQKDPPKIDLHLKSQKWQQPERHQNWIRNWNPNGPLLPHHSAVQLLGFIKAILISFPGAEGILSPVDTGYGSGDGKVTSSADQCRLKNMVQQQDNGKKIIKKGNILILGYHNEARGEEHAEERLQAGPSEIGLLVQS